MMVEFGEAVVAEVTMRCSQRSEDLTSFTEFEFEHVRGVDLISLEEKDSRLSANVQVFIRISIFRFYIHPMSRGENSRIHTGRSQHEEVRKYKENPLSANQYFPFETTIPIEL